MDVSVGFLALGLALTLIGVVMVYLSVRAGSSTVQSKGLGVIFLGPIPVVIGGSGKWVITALGVAAFVMVVLVVRAFEPNLIGW